MVEKVTIDEAIDKVKQWFKEKNFEDVIEGAKEILEVQPKNEEIIKLLKDAESMKATSGKQDEAEGIIKDMSPEKTQEESKITLNSTPTEETAAPAGEESKPGSPEDFGLKIGGDKKDKPQKEATKPTVQEPHEPSKPASAFEGKSLDEISKEIEAKQSGKSPEEEVEKTETKEEKQSEPEKETKAAKPEMKEKPAKDKNKSSIIPLIVLIFILLAIGATLVVGYIFGWFDPAFEWILQTIGVSQNP